MTPPADPAPDALAAAVERVRKEKKLMGRRGLPDLIPVFADDRDLLCDGIDRLREAKDAAERERDNAEAVASRLDEDRHDLREERDALAADVAGLRSELAETKRQLEVSCSRDSLRLTAAEAEVTRLKRGDFTPEEFQNLCHHRDEKSGCTRRDFEDGCRKYQDLLFGPARPPA
jgi:predicted RNase H-like nuclease (RuvC/YqgF family)